MLFLISPAKSLDFESPQPDVVPTDPLFLPQATRLISLLRRKKAAEIAALMDLSDNLATLNVRRYKAWRRQSTDQNARAAAFAFDGDVYGGLDARSLSADDLAWAQQHLCVLSGLYGVLRPLDRIQPYRLEMSVRLENREGANLYQFWGDQIARYLNRRLRAQDVPVVVNLASQEYFKSVDLGRLRARVVECVFEEQREGGEYKLISFMAKRARGLMARHAITQRIDSVEGLQGFRSEGYAFDAEASEPDRLVFRRPLAAAG